MYTTNPNHKLHSNTIAASKYCCGRATDGFTQARWRGNGVVQGATIAEFVPKFCIATASITIRWCMEVTPTARGREASTVPIRMLLGIASYVTNGDRWLKTTKLKR